MFKTEVNGKVCYEIRNAGVINSTICEEEYNGVIFKVTTGDYQELLQLVSVFSTWSHNIHLIYEFS